MINTNNNVDFGAKPIAKTRGAFSKEAKGAIKKTDEVVDLVIYKLTKKDMPFLDKLAKVNINKYHQGDSLEIQRARAGQKDVAILDFEEGDKAFLVTAKDRPAGIITYTSDDEKKTIYNVATWNVEKGKELKNTLKSLVAAVFNAGKKSVKLKSDSYANNRLNPSVRNFNLKPKNANQTLNYRPVRNISNEDLCEMLDLQF